MSTRLKQNNKKERVKVRPSDLRRPKTDFFRVSHAARFRQPASFFRPNLARREFL